MQQVRVGLIGFGYAGATFHAPLIETIPGLRLTRIGSSAPNKVALAFPGRALACEPGAVIGAHDVELVVIATTNASHHPLAKQALEAGQHVVLEKPFTVTLAEAEELLDLAQRNNLLLSVFHNRRWDGDFLTVRQCVESGLLGEIHTMESHFDRFRPTVRQRWREQDLPGSGALYDLGSHLIDQALVLFGKPDSVNCDIGIQRAHGSAPDYFHLVLAYGARRVILHAGTVVRHSGPRFMLHGDQGSFIKYGLDTQESALLRREKPGDPNWGKDDAALHGEIRFGAASLNIAGKVETLAGCYEAYYQGIHAALTEGKPVPVTARDALAVIKVIELAVRSNAQRRSIAYE